MIKLLLETTLKGSGCSLVTRHDVIDFCRFITEQHANAEINKTLFQIDIPLFSSAVFLRNHVHLKILA